MRRLRAKIREGLTDRPPVPAQERSQKEDNITNVGLFFSPPFQFALDLS